MDNNAKRHIISLSCDGKECFRMIALLEFNTSTSTYRMTEYSCRRICRDWKCQLPTVASPSCNCSESVFNEWFEKIKDLTDLHKMKMDLRLDELRPSVSDIVCGVVSC